MNKKWLFVLIALLGLCLPAFGEASLLDTKQVSIIGGPEAMTIQAGVRPAKDLFTGVVVKLDMDKISSSHSKLRNTSIGLSLEYPILQASSILQNVDVNSFGYVGVKALWDIGTDDIYVDFCMGVDTLVKETKYASTHLRVEYVRPDGASPLPESMTTFGAVFRWRTRP